MTAPLIPDNEGEVERLLPCPFCGMAAANGPEDGVTAYNYSNSTLSFVRCDGCGITTEEGPRDEAIAAWNRRALSTPAQSGEEPTRAELDRQRQAKRDRRGWAWFEKQAAALSPDTSKEGADVREAVGNAVMRGVINKGIRRAGHGYYVDFASNDYKSACFIDPDDAAAELRRLRVEAVLAALRASQPPEQAGMVDAEADRDALLTALGFRVGPLGDGLSRKVILDDAAGLRPAMMKAREEASEAQCNSAFWQMIAGERIEDARSGLLLRTWNALREERRGRREAEAYLTAAQAGTEK